MFYVVETQRINCDFGFFGILTLDHRWLVKSFEFLDLDDSSENFAILTARNTERNVSQWSQTPLPYPTFASQSEINHEHMGTRLWVTNFLHIIFVLCEIACTNHNIFRL